ncbi:MAG: phage tail protein, partial [Verrucomicrobiota bacterium]
PEALGSDVLPATGVSTNLTGTTATFRVASNIWFKTSAFAATTYVAIAFTDAQNFTVTNVQADGITAATSGELTVTDDTRRIRSGDAVTLTTTGTLPGGLALATTYYAMRRGATGDKVIKLCTTWANAMAGTSPVAISSIGSGTHNITIASQRRYTADGSFDLDVTPQNNLEGLTTAGAGMVVCQGGIWRVLAGAWRAATKTINDDMLAGAVKVQARTPKSSLYNSVKGVYSDPANKWQTSDFSPITNATYVAQDNGETIWQDITLPFTTDSVRAQRIAKILLEKSRQQITVSTSLNMSGLSIAAGDTVAMTNSALGWSAKPFTVTSWTFDASGIALTLQEEASTCYDWDLGDETTVDSAPDTTLTPNWALLDPQNFNVYQGVIRDGGNWRTCITCRWNPPLDTRVGGYRLRGRYRSGDWVTLGSLVQGNRYEFDGVMPGDYDVAIQSVAMNGASSDWVQQSITVRSQADLLGAFGLPSPATAVLKLHWNGTDTIDHARLTLTLGDVPFTAQADAVMLCIALFDSPNRVPIASGGFSDTLVIDSAPEAIAARGTLTTLAGSTADRLELRTADNPFILGVPNVTRFWGNLTGDWHKAVSYDLTGFSFDPPFAAAPLPGTTLDWVELNWYDERPYLTRYGLLTALDVNGYPTGEYEIVRWQSVADVDGALRITNVARGQEGTTPIWADGLHMLYFPAPGAGTTSTVFPIANWTDIGGGVWQGDVDVAIAIHAGQWCAPISCGLYKVIGTDLIRSALVPVTLGGTI